MRRKGRRRKEDPTRYAAPGSPVAFIRGVNIELKIAEPRMRERSPATATTPNTFPISSSSTFWDTRDLRMESDILVPKARTADKKTDVRLLLRAKRISPPMYDSRAIRAMISSSSLRILEKL